MNANATPNVFLLTIFSSLIRSLVSIKLQGPHVNLRADAARRTGIMKKYYETFTSLKSNLFTEIVLNDVCFIILIIIKWFAYISIGVYVLLTKYLIFLTVYTKLEIFNSVG